MRKIACRHAGTIQAQIVDENGKKPQQVEESYCFPAAMPQCLRQAARQAMREKSSQSKPTSIGFRNSQTRACACHDLWIWGILMVEHGVCREITTVLANSRRFHRTVRRAARSLAGRYCSVQCPKTE